MSTADIIRDSSSFGGDSGGWLASGAYVSALPALPASGAG